MEILAPTNSQPRFVRWAIVLAIVIVLNILFLVIRSIAFPSPQYSDFCPTSLTNRPTPTTEATCTAAGGTWNGDIASGPKVTADQPTGYCDLTATCYAQLQVAEKAYSQKAFALSMILGVIAIIVGVLPLGSSIVSSGLSFGGVLALIIGSGSYWSEAGNWLRLAIAIIALVVLVYIGLKRFRD
jgi:hypothetical protein